MGYVGCLHGQPKAEVRYHPSRTSAKYSPQMTDDQLRRRYDNRKTDRNSTTPLGRTKSTLRKPEKTSPRSEWFGPQSRGRFSAHYADSTRPQMVNARLPMGPERREYVNNDLTRMAQ